MHFSAGRVTWLRGGMSSCLRVFVSSWFFQCPEKNASARPFDQQREERARADAAEQPDVEHHDRRHRLKRAEHDAAAGDRALGLEARGAKRRAVNLSGL